MLPLPAPVMSCCAGCTNGDQVISGLHAICLHIDVRLETAGAALALFLSGLPEDRSLLSQEGLVSALDKSKDIQLPTKSAEGLPF